MEKWCSEPSTRAELSVNGIDSSSFPRASGAKDVTRSNLMAFSFQREATAFATSGFATSFRGDGTTVQSHFSEGKETGGGTAIGKMSSQLSTLDDGRVQVVAEASVELTGRIAQVGRGLIQGVSHQLFLKFVECAKQRLEAEEGSPPVEEPENSEPVNIVPVIFRAIWSGIVNFFRGLFRRSSD